MKPYEIKGNCAAKRAMEVAQVGGLSVLLIGPLGSSKTTIREAFPAVRSAEMETCPCGHFHSAARMCICSTRQLARWYRRIERTAREFDIVLETCETPAKELLSNRKPDPQEDGWRAERISNARAARASGRFKGAELTDDATIRIAEMCLRRLSLTPGQYAHVLTTARAIADLDASEYLKAKHVAESVQYRADATIFRADRVLAESGKLAEAMA